jgi:septal ring-binding cell division protein DamX
MDDQSQKLHAKEIKMRTMRNQLIRLLTLFAVVLVAACGTHSMNAMAQAKQEFMAQNYALSYEKVQPAASQGDADAQYALGYMMYYGKGTKQDVDGSSVWFHKAAAQGQPQAIKALALLRQASQQSSDKPVVVEHKAVPAHAMVPHVPATAPTQSHEVVRDIAGVIPAKPTAPSTNHSLDAALPVSNATGSASPAMHQVQPASQPPVSPVPGQSVKPVAPKDMHTRFKSLPSGAAQWVSQQALMQRPASHYTIQVMGASREQALRRFAERHHLQHVSIYQTQLHGRPWYVLLQGDYPSHDAAKVAMTGLMAELKAAKPWMRAMAPIQADIRNRAEHAFAG